MLLVFEVIIIVMSVYATILISYSLFLSIFGFGKAKRDYPILEDRARFLILIAAHNEEAVIGSTINNLRKINYCEDLYDIYVVNDNSTDETEQKCVECEVEYINTSDQTFAREGVGKPAALQYGLRHIGFEKIRANYDLVLIIDADNHVDSNILSELNSQWYSKGEPDCIQSYLDSKNRENVVSLGYSMAYLISNRFFQLSKYRLGLPNSIGGTGYVVTSKYLINSGGFNYNSLTEDLEMEIEIVLSGGKILWNHFTHVYDEKPTDMPSSLKQRTRWMQGHWFVAFNNFFPLLKKALSSRKWRYCDQIMYLFSLGKAVQLLLVLVLSICSWILMWIAGNLHILNSDLTLILPYIFGLNIISLSIFVYSTLFSRHIRRKN